MKQQRDDEVAKREEKLSLDKDVKTRVDAWRGGKKNMRAILSTLHEIIPPGLGWEPVSLANLLQPSDVKKVRAPAPLPHPHDGSP